MTTNSGNEYPLASILCVVKNGVKSIRRAIDSILAQDYPNIEIIIQDGASTDGTLEILQEYGDKVKLVSEPDSGPGEGFSRALSRITGVFFGSCLADEEMLPYAVSWGVKSLHGNHELAAVYGDCYKTDIEGNIKSVRGGHEFDLVKLICVEVVPPFLCGFFKTSCFRQIQLSDPPEENADYEIWFKLGMKFQIMHSKKVVMKSSRHIDSNTCQAKTYPLQVQSKKRIMDRIFDDPATPDWIKSLRFRAYSGLYLWASNSIIGNYIAGLDTSEQALNLASEYYLESLKYEPDQELLKSAANKSFKLGIEFYRKGELEKALKFVELPLRYDPCFAGANQTSAVILHALGRCDEARDAAMAELKINPDNQELIHFIRQLPPKQQGVTNSTDVELADIKNEQALVEHILKDVPHLRSCLEQNKVVESALILRDWVSCNINISSGYMKFNPKDPVLSFNCFNKKKGAVWCGGASAFYVMILRLFGIPAASFGCSVDGVEGMSHRTTVVCDVTKNSMSFYLMDAYLNYHFADTNSGEILEFCEMVKRIRLKQYDSIRLMETKVSRPYLAEPGDSTCHQWIFPNDRNMPLIEKRNNVWIYGPASPSLMTWVPACWPDRLEELLDGRSLEQFMLDMMLCNTNYGGFGNKNIDKIFADKIASANRFSIDNSVRTGQGSVMKLKKYDIKQPNTKPPQPQGWEQLWNGYYQMTKVCSEEKRRRNELSHSKVDLSSGVLGEGQFERQLFVNIIANINKEHINMFELGAGRGDWCMSLAGVVDHHLIPHRTKTYRCLALEGEPTHFQWTRDHFEHQNINGVAVHGAIQSYNGFCKFDANPEPADNYGQSVKDRGNIEIPCYTIDWLMKDYSFDHLDIIHIDVQGAEYDALLGASEAINKKAIDYLLIGTHTDDMNEKIMELIGNKYNCIIDIVHRTHLIDTPIGKASMPVDGIMLMQRKGIETPLPEEIDGAQSNRLDAQSNSGGIVELEKDALVMVIDIHDEMPGDNAKALDGWQGYYEKNMANLCSLLEHCNDNNIKVQEALYYGTRSRRLKHIRFDYTLDDKLDYSQFSDVYFCGISLDQCVVNRPLGYFKLSHHSKTLLENCSFQGLKYTGPIDYCITKQPFKEVGRFENIKQLYGRIEEFLMINKINAANWAKKKNIKHSSVDLISGYDNHGSETEEKQQMFQSWIDRMGRAKKRIFYRDQTVQSLSFLADLVRKHKPTKIIELGTAAGMSLRTWISATSDTGIVAVDLDFSRLHDNKDIIPLDLSRVKLIEGNILQTDFTPLWDANDRVLFFVDAHDLDDAPIMNYILQNVASLLPEGSLIVVDDLWYSSETITESNVQKVFRWITSDQVDPLQAFEGHYAPYWKGGAFVGFKEVVPLMEWVNRNRIQLQFEHKGKTVAFECNKNITNYSTDNFNIDEFNKMTGKSFYNPLDKVMVVGNNDPADQRAKVLCQQAKALFVKRRIKESLQCLMSAMSLTKNITVGAYAIAICHARLENFDIALKALEFEMNSAIPHPWARKLFMGINEYLNGHQKEAKQSLPLDIKKHHEVNEKYLSVVVTSRNDDHGGNTLHRTQVFLSGLAEQCRRFDLNAELIIVEWNPPADRKRLYEVLDWPEDLGPLSVRFIEVPEEVHNSIGNSDKFPLFQMIAKNVGIRRAEGKFVLATNIDVLLNDELMQFISDKQLDENCFYRIDRYDTFNKEIPMNIDVTAQLEFCKNSLVRIQGLHGTKNISEMEGDHFAYGPGDKRIHSNACGDFTLMAKQKWIAFRAYPELPLWSIYVDSLFLHMPYVSGLRQVILPEPMRVYHIEHETGWEVISETMKERPSLNYHQQYLPWCQQMIAQSTPLTNNDDNWGYAKVNFKEHVIAGKQQGLTIFTIPKAFKDHTNVIQRNAIKSWMNLNLRPEIILFGNDKGTKEIAEEFGLTHIPDVNCNEFGTPQIDCLFNMAQQSASNDIIAYVNADIILFNDFIDAANNVENKSEKFLMVGQHWDVGITEHVNFDDNQWSRRLLDRVKLEGQQHSPTGIDYFVFKKGLWPTIPPFAIGRTTWDNWLVAEALRQGGTVVDATDDVTVIHQEHDYAHLSGGKDEVWNGPEAKKNLAMAGGHGSMKWISHLNTALVGGEFVSNVVRQNRKGNACFEKGDMKGSIDAFDRITKIEPGNIIAHNNLGIAYQQDSEMSHALKSFAKAYQLDPHNRLTVFNIYRLYMQMGSQSDADRLLSKYLGARPADTAILQEIATLKETVTGNKKDRRKITSTSPAVSPPVVNVK